MVIAPILGAVIGLIIFWVLITINKALMDKHEDLVKAKDCRVCKKKGSMDCPNSSLCYHTDSKPYFDRR